MGCDERTERARTRTVRGNGLCADSACPRRILSLPRLCAWTECGRGLFLACPCRRNCRRRGRERVLSGGRSAAAPRQLRGRRILRHEGVTRALPKRGRIAVFVAVHVRLIARRWCAKDGPHLHPWLTKVVQVIHREFSTPAQNCAHESSCLVV